jgi:hypothetical protein
MPVPPVAPWDRDRRSDVSRYVDSTEQLVTEILVTDISASINFYLQLGFTLLRAAGDFAELIADPDGFGIRFASALESR